MKTPLIVAAILLAMPAHTLAATTICKIAGSTIAAKAISWDTETKRAKLQLIYGAPVDGKVVLTRVHEPYGTKVNISFALVGDSFGDELEFVVFPSSKTEFRAIGVAYKTIGAIKVLNAALGNNEALCNTL